MKATRWTDEKVKALHLPTGKREARKLVSPGLYLFIRARADGGLAKQWQYRAQVNGKRRWLSLGSYPQIGLAKAEQERLDHDKVRQAALKGEAEHPVTEAQMKRKAVKSNPTVAEAFEQMVANKRLASPRKAGKPVRERTIKLLQDSFDLDIRATIGQLQFGRLTPASIRSCIERPLKRGSPGAAAMVYRTLKGLVNFGLAREYINGGDPMRGVSNPRPYRPAPPNAADDAEIVHFLELIADSSFDDSSKGIIELQLLTGMRPSECRELQWRQVNLAKTYLQLAELDVKTGKPFRVHLSKPTIRLLRRAKLASPSSGYVFPGRVEDQPLSPGAVGYALRRKYAQAGVEPGKKLKPHDLRKTFRTMLSRLKVDGDVAGLCLNHTEQHVLRRIYDGHNYWDEMVDAWDRAGAHVDRLRMGGAAVPAFTKRGAGRKAA